MRNILFAILLLVLPAWLLMPLTNAIHAERIRLRYGGAHVNRQLRLQMGQGMAIALLAGFRGVVADFLWIQSHAFWERKEWLRQYRDMQVVVTLQPQSVLFWDAGAWHMAWNIGYAVSVDPANRTKAEGLKRQQEWWIRAAEFLQRGIDNIPNRYDLYFALGWLYEEKFKDMCAAEDYFAKAAEFKEAPTYVARMHARAQERCGDVRGAYQYWTNVWAQDHTKVNQAWNVVEREIKRLEDVLKIPDAQRVFPQHPGPAHP
jgi:hypothetical protein